MKVLVLGSGAKDCAVAWWFSNSSIIDSLFVAPGNPGTSCFAHNLSDVDLSDPESVYETCKKYSIDIVVIGTENPLIAGVPDYLINKGIKVFGAPGYAMKLEGDRTFARLFASRHGIPMPEYKVFDKISDLKKYINDNKGKVFCIKRNSLAPSRIMVDSSDSKVLVEFASRFIGEESVILEDHIDGIPLTMSVLIDGSGSLCLPIVSEYTKSEHSDAGSPTGGMGAVCPVPLNDALKGKVFDNIVNPTIEGMRQEGLLYKGVITFSMIANPDYVMLLDYHVRFNDPATQAFAVLIKNDIAQIMQAAMEDRLDSVKLEVSDKCSVAVVIAAKGYPDNPVKGIKVDKPSTIQHFNKLDSLPHVFYGAVSGSWNTDIVTDGGRSATVVGVGVSITEANSNVYNAINSIGFKNQWFRADIGNKFIENSSR